MHIHLEDREVDLTDDDLAYLNAIIGQTLVFANNMESHCHQRLLSKIMDDANTHGIQAKKLIEVMDTVHDAIHIDGISESKARALTCRLLDGHEELADELYFHVKFTHAVGMAALARAFNTLMVTENGDPTVEETTEHLRETLKEMEYGDWEVRTMMQRFDKAFEACSAEYFGSRKR